MAQIKLKKKKKKKAERLKWFGELLYLCQFIFLKSCAILVKIVQINVIPFQSPAVANKIDNVNAKAVELLSLKFNYQKFSSAKYGGSHHFFA